MEIIAGEPEGEAAQEKDLVVLRVEREYLECALLILGICKGN